MEMECRGLKRWSVGVEMECKGLRWSVGRRWNVGG